MTSTINREAMRRGSVDLQQQALWKQQQNLEEIKLLKSTTSQAVSTQQPVSNPVEQVQKESTPPKLSKLSARKMKTANAALMAVSRFSHSVSSPTKSDIASNISPPKQLHKPEESQFWQQLKESYVKPEDKTSEIEILLQEKRHWLERIHQDNEKMAKLLDVQLISNFLLMFYTFK